MNERELEFLHDDSSDYDDVCYQLTDFALQLEREGKLFVERDFFDGLNGGA